MIGAIRALHTEDSPMHPLGHGYEIDDDPVPIDIDAVHRFLSADSYWARGRSREAVEHTIRSAARVVGLYHRGAQVGFARATSDGASFAYLTDVYVLPGHRGGGRGTSLVRAMIDDGPLADHRWLLHTHDAHALYAKFGFAEAPPTLMERPARAASRAQPVAAAA